MVRVLTVAVLQIVTSFNYTYSGRCSTRHRLFKRLRFLVEIQCDFRFKPMPDSAYRGVTEPHPSNVKMMTTRKHCELYNMATSSNVV